LVTSSENTKYADVSIVIVNWKTRDELQACLSSLSPFDSTIVEIIVVDNASNDGSVEMVQSEFPNVHIIANPANFGFAKAANIGITASQGRYILLLNPDTKAQPNLLPPLIQFADENPDIGIIGPKILNPDGSLQYSCRRFPSIIAAAFRNTFLGKLFPRNPYTRDYLMAEWDHSEVKDVDWVSGAAMFVRRKLLNEIGLLDERFYMYCEDVDLAFRAWKHGWRVTYYPHVSVTHTIGRSSDRCPNRMIIEFHKSMYRLYSKHYAPTPLSPKRLIVLLGLVARASTIILRNYMNYTRWLVYTKILHPTLQQFSHMKKKLAHENAKEHSSEG
jgi:GT2 family glycosyltransferase